MSDETLKRNDEIERRAKQLLEEILPKFPPPEQAARPGCWIEKREKIDFGKMHSE
jgi:hypothetical protein